MAHLRRLFPAVLLLVLGLAASARAQQPLSLAIQNGRVTLHAQNVGLRQILAEWARVGGATIVNADRIVGAPVSLDLKDVPERQALDILLRGVAGYVLGARPNPSPATSSIDRILILATSNAPTTAAAPAAPGPNTTFPRPPFANGPGARFPQPRVTRVAPEENPPGDADQAPPDSGNPVVPRRIELPTFGNEPSVIEGDRDEVADPGVNQTPGLVTIGPANPQGVPPGASATPGTVVPLPRARPAAGRDQNPD